MTKILEASCVAGVVQVGSLPIAGATILSEGVASSEGILILQGGDGKFYVAKTSPDLKTTLEKVASALTQIAAALTILDGKPLGTLTPVPGAATQIAAITSLQTEVAVLKEMLK